ncbi:MAG: hypothetical protein NVSMB12_20440 [Acidimicrobiales bacterium]
MLRPARDEGGFTLVELLVTMTVFLLVSGALLSAMESGMRTERRASGRIDDEQTVRLALAQLGRDVRNADALTPSALATLPDELDLVNGPNQISWRYDPSAGALTRAVTSGGTTTPGVVVRNATNGLQPVFRLLGRAGADLAAIPGETAADVYRCAVAVEASVTAGGRPGVGPFTETSVAELGTAADLEGCP